MVVITHPTRESPTVQNLGRQDVLHFDAGERELLPGFLEDGYGLLVERCVSSAPPVLSDRSAINERHAVGRTRDTRQICNPMSKTFTRLVMPNGETRVQAAHDDCLRHRPSM